MKNLSKKNNRKNRAMQFIRYKNQLSAGNRVSTEKRIPYKEYITYNAATLKETVFIQAAKTIDFLTKKYRLKFQMEPYAVFQGYEMEDPNNQAVILKIDIKRSSILKIECTSGIPNYPGSALCN